MGNVYAPGRDKKTGMTDYLAIFENTNKGMFTGKKNYFIVMGNVYAPGRDKKTGIQIIDEIFESLPWDKFDLKGSWRKRFNAAKKDGNVYAPGRDKKTGI